MQVRHERLSTVTVTTAHEYRKASAALQSRRTKGHLSLSQQFRDRLAKTVDIARPKGNNRIGIFRAQQCQQFIFGNLAREP